jgi:ribosomal protein L37E
MKTKLCKSCGKPVWDNRADYCNECKYVNYNTNAKSLNKKEKKVLKFRHGETATGIGRLVTSVAIIRGAV